MFAMRALIVLTGFLLAFSVYPVLAQSDAERVATEKRLRALEEQIARDRQTLSKTTEAEEASRETLEQLDREIALREELTRTYQRRIRQLNYTSDSIRTSIGSLEADIATLKEQYFKRALHAYKYGRLHDLALILSAQSINQMLIRASYLNRFADQRRQKLGNIEKAAVELKNRRDELQATRQRNEQLLSQAREEELRLTRLKKDRNQVLKELVARRSDLEGEIRKKEAAATDLANLIRRLTASAKPNRSVNTESSRRAAAAYSALSGSFLQNQGRLPWPVEGALTEEFGNRVSPVYGTTTTNPGILIATVPAAEVHAIFDGEVILVDAMPEYGTLVSVAHGEYQTVYSNFSMVYVKKGDQVKTGQLIGRAGTPSEPQNSSLFFALFRNGQAVNPVPWLTPR